MRRWKIAVATAVAATAAAIGASPLIGPASASSNGGAYGTTFVDGAGKLTNDFGDHYSEIGGNLCNGCGRNNTDIVILWQSILYAEGLLSKSGIDGYFGRNTASATKAWQRRFGLNDDGYVGTRTWGAADNRLRWSTSHNSYVRYNAKGTNGRVLLIRGNLNDAHSGGAYRLDETWNGVYGQGNTQSFGPRIGGRIYFNKRTLVKL